MVVFSAKAKDVHSADGMEHGIQQGKKQIGIFKLIEDEAWSSVVSLCQKSPLVARTWGYRGGIGSDAPWRRLPIHEACMQRPSTEVIQIMIDAYPLGVQCKDHDGKLALHHACEHGASTEVVHQLLLAYPESLEVKDLRNRTPLSIARASAFANRDSVVESLRRGRSFWHVKMEEKKWMKDREEKLASLRNMFQEERNAYQSRIGDVENRASIERRRLGTMITDLENENMMLKEEMSIMRKKGLRSEVEHALQSELEQAKARLAENSASKVSLENQVQTMKMKLDTALENASQLQEEVMREKSKAVALYGKLQQTNAAEKNLELKIEEVNAKLREVMDEAEESKVSLMEQKRTMDAENDLLRTRLADVTAKKEAAEAKAKEDARTIATMSKSSTEKYKQSAERISELEQKVVTLSADCDNLVLNREEHEDQLVRKIHNLEDQLKQLSEKKASKQEKEDKDEHHSFRSIDAKLASAEAEHKRVMDALHAHRTSRQRTPRTPNKKLWRSEEKPRRSFLDEETRGERIHTSVPFDLEKREELQKPSFLDDLEKLVEERKKRENKRSHSKERQLTPSFLKRESHGSPPSFLDFEKETMDKTAEKSFEDKSRLFEMDDLLDEKSIASYLDFEKTMKERSARSAYLDLADAWSTSSAVTNSYEKLPKSTIPDFAEYLEMERQKSPLSPYLSKEKSTRKKPFLSAYLDKERSTLEKSPLSKYLEKRKSTPKNTPRSYLSLEKQKDQSSSKFSHSDYEKVMKQNEAMSSYLDFKRLMKEKASRSAYLDLARSDDGEFSLGTPKSSYFDFEKKLHDRSHKSPFSLDFY